MENVVATEVSEATVAIEVVEKKTLTIITDFAESHEDDIKLDVIQERIVSVVIDEAKAAAEPILNNGDLPISVKLTKLLGAIMALLEKARINGAKIASENKRVIALYLVKRLVKEVLKDSALRAELLHEISCAATHLLEALVDVSKGMNVLVKAAEKAVMDKVESCGCCASLMSMINSK